MDYMLIRALTVLRVDLSTRICQELFGHHGLVDLHISVTLLTRNKVS